MVGLPHIMRATFPVTILSRNLWLSVKDALEGVKHHETGLDTFSGPFSPENHQHSG